MKFTLKLSVGSKKLSDFFLEMQYANDGCYEDRGAFVIVDFHFEDTLQTAIVPDFWLVIEEGQLFCSYPPGNKTTITPIKMRHVQHDTWVTYPATWRRDYESYSKARKDLPNAVQYTDFAESDSESQQSKAVSRKSVRRSSRWKRKISSDESGNDSGHETLLSNRPSPPRSLGYGLLSRDIEEPPDDVRPDAQKLSDEYDDLDLKLEEFVRFENMLLVDERKRASSVRFVRNIGGVTEGDSVHRAWKEVVSVEVRVQCNWNGVRRGTIKKHKLNKSPLVLAVWNGLRQNPACSKSTDAALQFETVKSFVSGQENRSKKNLTS
ncbi:uncharacterized protein LOC124204962 [Daphnia pulex]|uniref:uncharacterized protein LOC124204962 n=1 Tax=Daphnia pulex TaxID=6669 RepID=UPI001EDF9E1E|nr:uncharacterized protein LOC124204962 [Daphnia pulex]